LLLAVLFAALALPSPSPTPLRTIVHERSSPFCTQLREKIGVSVAGLLHNDEWVDYAKSSLAKMGRDWVTGGGLSVQIDRVRIDRSVGGIVQNLTIIDRLLSNMSGQAQDERIAAMRDQLLAAADQQREVLNILEIVLNSQAIDEQLIEFYKNNPRASHAAIANVQTELENDPTVYRDPVLGRITGIFSSTPFAEPLLYLVANDLQTHALESRAAASILKSGSACHSDVASSAGHTLHASLTGLGDRFFYRKLESLEVLFGIHRRSTTCSSCGNGLFVTKIVDVARYKNAFDVGRHAVGRSDIAHLV